jgi:septal ring factor EnvC (AmiA/AmiB activator)
MTDALSALVEEVAALTEARQEVADQLDALDETIERHRSAIAALRGEPAPRRRSRRPDERPTTKVAIMAALATFSGPVLSATLMDHDDLAHYSRHTLRSALTALQRSGEIRVVERTPKGFIYAPLNGGET